MKNLANLLFFLMLFIIKTSAQTNYLIVCQDKQLWLVNDTQAVMIEKCKNKDWAAPVKLETKQIANRKQGKIEKQVVAALGKTSKEQFKPVSLSETNLKQALQNQSNQSVIILDSNKLQPFIKDFLEPSMELIIVRGSGTKDIFIETVRFTIKLGGSNPTIKEMLDEIRKVYTNKADVKEYGEFYILLEFPTWKELDEKKTAADYNLKSGDKLMLSFDYERYKNLPPGIRGGAITKDN